MERGGKPSRADIDNIKDVWSREKGACVADLDDITGAGGAESEDGSRGATGRWTARGGDNLVMGCYRHRQQRAEQGEGCMCGG